MSFSIYLMQANYAMNFFWPFNQCSSNSESGNNLLWRKGFEKTWKPLTVLEGDSVGIFFLPFKKILL